MQKETMDFPDQSEPDFDDRAYRRGYYQGMAEVIRAFERGYSLKEISRFVITTVYKWRYPTNRKHLFKIEYAPRFK